MKRLKRHGRRIGVVLLSSFLGRNWFYFLIGFFNKLFPTRPIKTIFLLYPASQKYLLDYVYLWWARMFRWRPCLLGFFNQNSKWGLTFGISAIESDFFNLGNENEMRILIQRMENIKKLIGADQKTFAGVLPGLFSSRGILNGEESIEKQTTVQAVQMAIEIVKEKEELPEETPVMVLGGLGFIGSGFRKNGNSRDFYFLDLNDREYFFDFTRQFNPHPVIVLNLTKKGALSEYIPYFWPGVVLLNEVYPEPSKAEVESIKAKGACCYHIAGVKAKAWPAFPRGYQGGIPCCASFLPENEDDGAFEVIVRKM